MICNNNYLADILRVCEIKDLICVMRFQSPLVYFFFFFSMLSKNKKWCHDLKIAYGLCDVTVI